MPPSIMDYPKSQYTQPERLVSPLPEQSNSTDSNGRAESILSDVSYLTDETEPPTTSAGLAPLQEKGLSQDTHEFDPLEDEEDDSYDLVAPAQQSATSRGPSVEQRSKQLMSREHLQAIFSEPSLFQRFAGFLASHRQSSIPILIYYLDAIKSLKAISYANALAGSLESVGTLDFTQSQPVPLINKQLQEKADKAFEIIVQNDLPAYMALQYIDIVSPTISARISGSLAPHLLEASEGLAEVFCLTDPSREDMPIVFASEEFTRTTQYGLNYIIGRNCRFLQGPETDRRAVRRLKEALDAGREHNEVVLNYRRDGSPFLNLLMMAPLTDSRGHLRYYIGAQIDISGLVKAGTDVDGLNKMLAAETSAKSRQQAPTPPRTANPKDEFESLVELFNHTELKTVSHSGGRIYREDKKPTEPDSDDENQPDDAAEAGENGDIIARRMPHISTHISRKPRLLLREPSSSEDDGPSIQPSSPRLAPNGRLSGVFQQYLLVRPYPSLRILFTSPSLRVPGILQSPLMSRIGGSSRVKDNLNAALAEGRGVTAKVKWVTRFDADGSGKSRYLHFTPLIGAGGKIGVWMVVMVDAEASREGAGSMGRAIKEGRRAPAVMGDLGDRAANREGSVRSGRSGRVGGGKGDRYHALRREEAGGGIASRGSSRDGSTLSVRI